MPLVTPLSRDKTCPVDFTLYQSFNYNHWCIFVPKTSNNCCIKMVGLHYAACHHIHEWMSFIARKGCADCHNRGCHRSLGDYAALWWYSDLFVTLLYLIHSWCNIRGCFHSFSDSSYRYIINDLWMCLGNLNNLKVKRWEYFWKYFILTSITTYYHGWMIF